MNSPKGIPAIKNVPTTFVASANKVKSLQKRASNGRTLQTSKIQSVGNESGRAFPGSLSTFE
jgi:hypothetical protein